MKARHVRFLWLGVGAILLIGAVSMVLLAFKENLVFFQTPSDIAAGKVPQGRNFRIGGMVVAGSLKRQSDGLTVQFAITDTAKTVPVRYTGPLPDLFREGKGAVALGQLDAKGVFIATEILAKHDENYMPPEAKEALKRAHEGAKTLQQ